jgi:hypothetical protein
MQRSFFCVIFGYQFLDPGKGDLVADSLLDALVSLNHLVDFDTLVAHGTRLDTGGQHRPSAIS